MSGFCYKVVALCFLFSPVGALLFLLLLFSQWHLYRRIIKGSKGRETFFPLIMCSNCTQTILGTRGSPYWCRQYVNILEVSGSIKLSNLFLKNFPFVFRVCLFVTQVCSPPLFTSHGGHVGCGGDCDRVVHHDLLLKWLSASRARTH